MKYQIVSAALGSMMLTVLSVSPGFAQKPISPTRIVKEVEPNNQSASSPIGITSSRPIEIKGQMFGNDSQDLYALNVGKNIARFRVSMALPRQARWELREDRNGNRRIDRGDRIILNNRNGTVNKAGSKRYLLRIHQPASTPVGGTYRAFIQPIRRVTVKQRRVILTIISASTKRRFDLGFPGTKKSRADFYVKVDVNGKQALKTKTVKNNNRPVFNKTLVTTLPVTTQSIKYKIRLLDSDIGRDDKANISPKNSGNLLGSKHLIFRYRPATGRVSLATGHPIGRRGQAITVKGHGVFTNGIGNRERLKGIPASITFKIDHKD
ncbi:hypothetical protein IQ266_04530 [filamentous cyanobacterium LEGE 11480]|uniref:C2 domain-containing protein n=1 Tax=Romeriopsis navalis LEGE 11480 TaxID=2777977 RepID=A0A928Z2G5_9CYAN|nr:hypothetical protein [Romeriopsis navalis]MBE9029027.1 hypothetical protein [Romeriopsis navalis LEGE 11480]